MLSEVRFAQFGSELDGVPNGGWRFGQCGSSITIGYLCGLSLSTCSRYWSPTFQLALLYTRAATGLLTQDVQASVAWTQSFVSADAMACVARHLSFKRGRIYGGIYQLGQRYPSFSAYRCRTDDIANTHLSAARPFR